ncbi:hypothetical protein [Paenibacillus sp. HW567]|uniref:hypothetical protein n=1 Tax=Paenibacillus sp. HW567 TaxID=1034769 RepID=UPI00036897C1|nr:hypothetical protein [Paenibacillus sp. HW567]
MPVYYLSNVFQGSSDPLDNLLDLVFSIPECNEFLFFEYGYSYQGSFSKEGVEIFEDNTNRIWFRPKNKKEEREIDDSFVINCIVLVKDKEMDSCKFKLSIVEAPESIELMVTEFRSGNFQELLKTRLKPYLERGVKVLTEEMYNNMIDEQFSRNQWVFKKK